jgi:hypothetical protein
MSLRSCEVATATSDKQYEARYTVRCDYVDLGPFVQNAQSLGGSVLVCAGMF